MRGNGPLPFLTRSWLLIPAAEMAALAAGARSGADVLVIDLKALQRDDRIEGAARILSFLNDCNDAPMTTETSHVSGKPVVFVLLPALDDGGATLLKMLAPGKPEGFALSGAVDGAEIQHLDVLLGVEEALHGWEQDSTRIAAFLSLPPRLPLNGLSRRLQAIGWASDETARLTGAERMHDADGELTDSFRQARAAVLLAAAVAAVDAIDAPSGIFSSERLARDCREAAADGFTGKAALSPRQVSAINHAFSPTPQRLIEARAIAAAPQSHDARTLARALQSIQRTLPHQG